MNFHVTKNELQSKCLCETSFAFLTNANKMLASHLKWATI